MKDFIAALVSDGKHNALPEECDYFGKLIGSWKINYVDNSNGRAIEGEWHFARILEGMAVQDVIILPGFECGTTLRVYNPVTRAWDVAYCYTGRIMRFEAGKQGDKIVLTNIDNAQRKWVFVEIGDDFFHWQDVTVEEDGKWHVDYDLYARRA